MAILYKKSLGGQMRISDIVFAGSHDASIKSGSSYAKTQDKDIFEQAYAGVRLFDLRILARGHKDGSASLVGYHGSAKKKFKGFFSSSHSKKDRELDVAGGISGEFGLKLSTMLADAKEFVTLTGEFLIFKFDKCTNYPLIADYCVSILGDAIYKSGPETEFSKQTLDDLSGKVICVFNDKDKGEQITDYDESHGILGFRNLNGDSPQPYKAKYPGLQYYGKGGTRWYAFWKTNAGKMDENKKKQKKLMAKMASMEDQQYTNVLGMMYWTATGSVSSIKSRNKVLWKKSGVKKLEKMWTACLEQAIEAQLDSDEARYMPYDQGGFAKGARIKSFFPNIVMIDFANEEYCDDIFSLNTIANDKLAAAFDEYGEDDD